ATTSATAWYMWYRAAVSNTSRARASSRSRRPCAANAPAAIAIAAFSAPSAIQGERASVMRALYPAVRTRARWAGGSQPCATVWRESARDRQGARRRGEHARLRVVHRDDERLAEDVAQRAARDAVQRRAVDVRARVLRVLVGDHDRVILVRQREQPADRRLDPAQVPAALDRRAMDRTAAAIVREEDAAAAGHLGAHHPAGRIVGVGLLLGVEPAQVLDLGPQQRADLVGVRLDRGALEQVDVAAVLAARVELLAVGLDHRAAMRHAIGGEPAREDRRPRKT